MNAVDRSPRRSTPLRQGRCTAVDVNVVWVPGAPGAALSCGTESEQLRLTGRHVFGSRAGRAASPSALSSLAREHRWRTRDAASAGGPAPRQQWGVQPTPRAPVCLAVGRKKIKIERIADERSRQVTFMKRKVTPASQPRRTGRHLARALRGWAGVPLAALPGGTPRTGPPHPVRHCQAPPLARRTAS